MLIAFLENNLNEDGSVRIPEPLRMYMGCLLYTSSGENALNVADSIFKTVHGIELKKLSGYKAAFGRLFFDGKPIDEAVALVFRAPKSYTGEDVVEISCLLLQYQTSLGRKNWDKSIIHCDLVWQ